MEQPTHTNTVPPIANRQGAMENRRLFYNVSGEFDWTVFTYQRLRRALEKQDRNGDFRQRVGREERL